MIQTQTLYTSGKYLEENPLWHADESPWKAEGIVHMLEKHALQPRTICEVGCGAGEILHLLQKNLSAESELWGYDISPQAIAKCQPKENRKLHFAVRDIVAEPDGQHFDLILLMDILEHLEDYFSFLRALQSRGEYKIIQLPMDISLRSVLLNQLPIFYKSYGHLHYFTKDVALQMIRNAGYEIIDYAYNGPRSDRGLDWQLIQRRPWLLPKKMLGLFKRAMQQRAYDVLFTINPDLAVRLTGRQRLLILAR